MSADRASEVSAGELAMARELAAEALEVAIAGVGMAYRNYVALTTALGTRVGKSDLLGRRVDTPIAMHLIQAGGLAPFLERKLVVGIPPALRTAVELEHDRVGVRTTV